MSTHTLPSTIEFNQPKKYRVLRVLGAGACGQTVLLKDDEVDAEFVAKKYRPGVSRDQDKTVFDDLLTRFKNEAQILFRLNHPNIVRVFNFYDYRKSGTAFIIMEYISGDDIVHYLTQNPDKADVVFEKTIDGFAHLESKGILHRDIRPMNILVTDSGEPKIIDFGFGKVLDADGSLSDKSITLNWWCTPPPEIGQSRYDFQTEVYFVGKLFEEIIMNEQLTEFKHRDVLRQMCLHNRQSRIKSFDEIQQQLGGRQFEKLSFSEREVAAYRNFTSCLTELVIRIEHDATYKDDLPAILHSLDNILTENLLEEFILEPVKLARIFIKGGFRYRNTEYIPTKAVGEFLSMIRSLPAGKRAIVMRNLLSRLNAIPRSDPPTPFDDEIPF